MTVVAEDGGPVPDVGTGIVMPIGGAEDKIGRMTILREVVRLAGGPDASLVVLSTASSLGDEITHAYLQLFGSLGIRDVIGIRPESRAQAADAELVAAVDRSSAIFMTGGNQVKLATLVVGTPLGKAIVAAHRRGALVAGTSAGASICSTHMVSFGSGGSTPKFRIGQVSEGLGLLDGMIIDQHFTQRNRFGRLLALVAANPAQLGVGIDEDRRRSSARAG
jgi:cyanophycinase